MKKKFFCSIKNCVFSSKSCVFSSKKLRVCCVFRSKNCVFSSKIASFCRFILRNILNFSDLIFLLQIFSHFTHYYTARCVKLFHNSFMQRSKAANQSIDNRYYIKARPQSHQILQCIILFELQCCLARVSVLHYLPIYLLQIRKFYIRFATDNVEFR